MPVEVGQEIPDFTLDSQMGSVSLHDLISERWCLLITLKSAFDPVTTSEIVALHRYALQSELQKRNITVVSVGCDTVQNYRKWSKEIDEYFSLSTQCPIVSDPSCSYLQQVGCAGLTPPTMDLQPTSLGCFLIDQEKKVRIKFEYPPSIARNFTEILRLYDAMQVTIGDKTVVPYGWTPGSKVFVSNDLSDEEAVRLVSDRMTKLKPWLREVTL